MAAVKLFLFGSPEIQINGSPVEVDTRKATALLAYLALTRETHRRDTLATLLWPELDQSHALAALRRTLSSLKKSIKDKCLDITRETIGLSSDDCLWTDVDEFHQLVGGIQSHPHSNTDVCPACIPNLTQAASLHRGEFMAGFTLRDSHGFDSWQMFQADALKREFSLVLEKLACALSSQGDYEGAIDYANRWLSLDPLREEAHQRLMKIYAMSGRRSAALRQYRECVRVLDRELGVPPLEETTAIYHEILEGQTFAEDEPAGPQTGKISSPAFVSIQAPRLYAQSFPFVGRTWELDALLNAYYKNREQGVFFGIEGEAGIGKTRLALEFIDAVQRSGANIISTQCYEGESILAYAPFIDGLREILSEPNAIAKLKSMPKHWLAEVSRLMPEYNEQFPDLPLMPPLDGTGAKTRFFEAIRQLVLAVCTGSNPGVLFIDDIHWADESSLELLQYLVRRIQGTNTFILVTWRDTELPSGYRIRNLILEIKRSGRGEVLSMGRLTRKDLSKLIKAILPSEARLPVNFEEHLFTETEGLPFFVVEYLADLQKSDYKQMDDSWKIPDQIRELIIKRIDAIDETSWQLLTAAGVIGRNFSFPLLTMTSGRSDMETIKGLETLIQFGLLVELETREPAPQPVYDFTHNKIRQVVYEETSLARRRLLHKRVAEAMLYITSTGRNQGALAGQIAKHFQMAGNESEAANFYKIAGEHAQHLYANSEAISYYQASLALNHPDESSLHEAIGDLYTLRGEYRYALDSYEAAIAHSPNEYYPRLEHKIGELYSRIGNWEIAICHFRSVEQSLAETVELAERALLYADWSRAEHYRGNSQVAEDLASKALAYAQESSDPLAKAQSLNVLGILARQQGNLTAARDHLKESVAASEEIENPAALVAALNNLSLVLSDEGEIADAMECLQTALDICIRLGDRHHEAALLNNLADLMHQAGEKEQALDYLKQAIAIFSEIGADSDSQLPEIWKLTAW